MEPGFKHKGSAKGQSDKLSACQLFKEGISREEPLGGCWKSWKTRGKGSDPGISESRKQPCDWAKTRSRCGDQVTGQPLRGEEDSGRAAVEDCGHATGACAGPATTEETRRLPEPQPEAQGLREVLRGLPLPHAPLRPPCLPQAEPRVSPRSGRGREVAIARVSSLGYTDGPAVHSGERI